MSCSKGEVLIGANELSKCILIVDDSAIMRRTLRKLFEAIPEWEVCGEAENGKDALNKAGKLDPDLVVLDLSMPVMNGFEAARELKKIRPEVPIIMYSIFNARRLEDEARAAGCNAVVYKADSTRNLIESMQRLLSAA
jgi:DNA-binding NarL/FixJ family response regulator